jgi:hypothetical protein
MRRNGFGIAISCTRAAATSASTWTRAALAAASSWYRRAVSTSMDAVVRRAPLAGSSRVARPRNTDGSAVVAGDGRRSSWAAATADAVS